MMIFSNKCYPINLLYRRTGVLFDHELGELEASYSVFFLLASKYTVRKRLFSIVFSNVQNNTAEICGKLREILGIF